MPLTTGQLARNAEVNVETIRYYERRGLLPEPPRTEAGYRQYRPEIVGRIRFIKRAQRLGFTLREIAELLDMRIDPGTNCAEVRQRAERKQATIDAKVRELRRIRSALDELVRACEERSSTGECPILERLEP
ncbi:MAG: MerR family DNA-binding protein [Gemmatimonadota bacterium]|nr:MerR family DNA-binding protein [Gemmatimonadota bacterium]